MLFISPLDIVKGVYVLLAVTTPSLSFVRFIFLLAFVEGIYVPLSRLIV